MSKLVLTAIGNLPDSVELDNDPDPALGSGELLVAMEAAPINPADFLKAVGWFDTVPAVPGPAGSEGVGRVLTAGSDKNRKLVGKRVIVLPSENQGTWADKAVVRAENVVLVGEKADALQLAMLAVNPVTAHALLNGYVQLGKGDWIGQNLGSSAVGRHVVTLAKRAGVRTLSIVRTEAAATELRALGADLVVVDGDDLRERLADALGDTGLRVAFDGVGGSKGSDLAHSLEFGGTLVTYSSVDGTTPALDLADLIYKQLSVRSFFIMSWLRSTPRKVIEKTYAELGRLVEDGVLRAAVEATYPLARHGEALAHAQKTGRTGKILFTFGSGGAS